MGYKAAVQILKQADDLKEVVSRKCDLLNDSQAWTDQQRLQNIFHQVLVLDLEYALDKKVEQDLWNIGFKTHITVLQELVRDKKNPRRSDLQALLTWCLESASGFYLSLLQELCNIFDVDLPFRRRGNLYGQSNFNGDLVNSPQSSSCLYICQYCLVHLGDIARYRNQRRQAESFYKQAILVSPISGHPYNQLALLEASRGDKLSTVFYYIRGIAVKNPFPAATTNLLSTLNSTIDKENPLDRIQTKITANEFIQIFLQTHAFLHTATDLNQAKLGIKCLNTTMTALVATQSFNTDKLIKITAINLYALKHVGDNKEELTEDEKLVREYVLDILAASLSAFLVPVHTLKCDKTLLDYYALPAVKLLMDWIKIEPQILTETVFSNRLQIWPSLCKLLNNVQQYIKDFDYTKYATTPLPEDKILQGFRPLQKTFKELDFKAEIVDDLNIEEMIRIKRIIDFAQYLADLEVNESFKLITRREGDVISFEPLCMQPDPTNDLLEEMKSFNVTERPKLNVSEKKGGILKPQGSLEKSREERELLTSDNLLIDLSTISPSPATSLSTKNKEVSKTKRPKQNVAIQSIFKKLEENKQVKFNVSDKEKEQESPISNNNNKVFEIASAPSTSQYSPLRSQTFNQNHPIFSPNPQSDYLNTLRNLPQQELNVNHNIPFPPKTDVPPPNMKMMSPPYQNQNYNYNARVLPPPPPPPGGGGYNQYQHLNNNLKMDEPSGNWWPPNYQQRDFSGNNYLGPPFGAAQEFNRPSSQQSGDLFNPTWSNFGRSSYTEGGSFDGGSNLRLNNVVKENPNGLNRESHEKFSIPPPTSQSYSLFNNTWTPNLMGQLRNMKGSQENPIGHMPQHSLFTGQGPQSLAQLLEQQQSQKK